MSDNLLIEFLNCSRQAFFVKLVITMSNVLHAWTEISPSGDASIAHYHLLCVRNACEYPMFRHHSSTLKWDSSHWASYLLLPWPGYNCFGSFCMQATPCQFFSHLNHFHSSIDGLLLIMQPRTESFSLSILPTDTEADITHQTIRSHKSIP